MGCGSLKKSKPVKKRSDTLKNSLDMTRSKTKFPLPFKSPYICFSLSKQNEVSKQLGSSSSADEVAQRLALIWKNYSANERLIWEKESEKDKKRYEVEKLKYNVTMQNVTKTKGDNPAEVYYLKKMLLAVKEKHPSSTFKDLQKTIEEIWKSSSDGELYGEGKLCASENEETVVRRDITSQLLDGIVSYDKPPRSSIELHSTVSDANTSDLVDIGNAYNYTDLRAHNNELSNLQRLVELGRIESLVDNRLLQGADMNLLQYVAAQNLHQNNAGYFMNPNVGLSHQIICPGSSASIATPTITVPPSLAHSLSMRQQLQSQISPAYFIDGYNP